MQGVFVADTELPIPEGLQVEGKGPLAFLYRLKSLWPLLLVSGLVGRDRICIVLKRDNPQCVPDTEYVLTNCLLLL